MKQKREHKITQSNLEYKGTYAIFYDLVIITSILNWRAIFCQRPHRGHIMETAQSRFVECDFFDFSGCWVTVYKMIKVIVPLEILDADKFVKK